MGCDQPFPLCSLPKPIYVVEASGSLAVSKVWIT
jgi:hypothetical protein